MLQKNNPAEIIIISVISILLMGIVSGISSSININVIDTRTFKIDFVPIDEKSSTFTETVFNNTEFINSTYPLANGELLIKIKEEIFDSNIGFVLDDSEIYPLLRDVYKSRKLSNIFTDRVVGILPNGWFANHGRNGTKGISVSRNISFLVYGPNAVLVEEGVRHSAAHEIGHTLGLCDEHSSDKWHTQKLKLGVCPNGDLDNNGSLDQICLSDPEGCPTSTFGELIPWSSGNGIINLYNMMGSANNETLRWIDSESYVHLLDIFSSLESILSVDFGILISGAIHKNGTVEIDDYSYILDERYIQNESSIGNFSLIVEENATNLFELKFEPQFLVTEIGGNTTEVNVSAFAFVLPFSNNVTKILIKNNTKILDEVNRTANTPSLNITTNLEGQIFTKRIFNVTWNGTDVDNDTLAYAVLFSADNGSNYTTLEIDFNDTKLELNSSELEECEECKVKVLATDGINTNSSVSKSFKIRNELLTNITSCQELNVSFTSYKLQNNVQSNGTCFTITANDITLDGKGYKITYGVGGSSGYGVYVFGMNQTIIKNLIFEEGNTSGTSKYNVYFRNANNNAFSNNIINTSGLNSYGIRLDASSYNLINNNSVITSGSADAIRISPSNSNFNIISNNTITTSTNGARGIYIEASVNNTFRNNQIRTANNINSEGIYFVESVDGNMFYDSFINASTTNDVYFSYPSSGIVNFKNVTLTDTSGPAFDSSSTARANVYWYFDAQVNNAIGNSIENANVTAKNVSGAIAFSQLTNANGRISRQEILQYWRNSSVTRNQNNYTFNVSKLGYPTLIRSINITSNRDEVFTLGGITSCATLNGANVVYSLGPNISSTGTCFTISADNITLFGGSPRIITYNTAGLGGTGIDVNANNFTLRDIITYASSSSGTVISLDLSGNSSTVYNSNLTAGGGNDPIIYFSGENGSVIVYDSFIGSGASSGSDYELYFTNNRNNATLVNTTLKNNIFSWNASNSFFYFAWYLNVQVNDSSGNPIASANVSASDKNGLSWFNVITDINGGIAREHLAEYKRNVTGKFFLSNYTINVSKSGFIEQTRSINMSLNKLEIFNLNPI